MRDHRKLRTFALADSLVPAIYKATLRFPVDERFGLQSQIRRAAISVSTNIVEGSARQSTREYAHFLQIAFASAVEVAYLLSVGRRLGLGSAEEAQRLETKYDELIRRLKAQIDALARMDQ
jgi:four helix bundle protein